MIKKGDKVTTVHSEKLTVLDTKTIGEKRKKGKVIKEGKPYFLAHSGDHKVWFPVSKVKEDK